MNTPDQLSAASDSNTPEPREREWGTKLFLGFLFVVASFYAIILIYHSANPPETVSNEGVLEQCRQICLKYGLISTGNVRKDAEAYLQFAQTTRLTSALSDILADTTAPAASQKHSLLEKTAPDFSLPDDAKLTQTLSELGHNRPVVVVFYLGYGCSHCVAQLLALDKDLHYFRELDADIVAISSDPSEHTAARFVEYGRFGFPVLSDADQNVAAAWGVFKPATDDQDEVMDHGTFVIDRNGKVVWAFQGKEPFLDNRTLLHVIAKSQGLLPDTMASNN
ncbi:MAG: redoxin domain-containing protein [Planctomycetaceae bacterium]